MAIMSILREFFSSPTRMSSVVLTILAMIVYAISPPDDSWVLVGAIAVHVVPAILMVMIYEICSICQARDRARSASIDELIDCDAPHHSVSSANIFGIPSMNDEEISDLAVHNCKCTGLESGPSCSEDTPPKHASSSLTSASASASAQESLAISMPGDNGSTDELLCNICLEPVVEGDLVCCFPCIHQVSSIFLSDIFPPFLCNRSHQIVVRSAYILPSPDITCGISPVSCCMP